MTPPLDCKVSELLGRKVTFVCRVTKRRKSGTIMSIDKYGVSIRYKFRTLAGVISHYKWEDIELC